MHSPSVLRLLAAGLVANLAACAPVTSLSTDVDASVDVGPPSPVTISAISTGDYHACALTSRGGVKCWGTNEYGQLGDGTTEQRQVPRDVTGLTMNVQATFAGGNHQCARSPSGPSCWGHNARGQLGDSSTGDRLSPTAVLGLTDITDLTGGLMHTCAITEAGGVMCWGDNASGQLGNNAAASSAVPRSVTGLSERIRQLTAGDDHTCALTEAGGVTCWGDNNSGQLGNNSTADSSTPVTVVGLSTGVAAIDAGGAQTCAVLTNGGARCWGNNARGQLGNGSTTGSLVPVVVTGLTTGVASISVGYVHTCIITTTGGLRCWGGNEDGQIGDGSTISRTTPVDVVGLSSGVVAVSASSGYFTCALTAAGQGKCWGNNNNGVLGNDTRTSSWVPVDVVGIDDGLMP